MKRLTGEEITHLQFNWIPKQSDHHFWGVDQSPRHFRDLWFRKNPEFPMLFHREKPGIISRQDQLPAEPFCLLEDL
jgi:hypothetical protein